jgi:hypothetical protein
MKVLNSILAVAIIATLASCGGGSGSGSSSSGKKLAANEFLGDFPNLVYQKHYSDSIWATERGAALEKAGDNEKKYDKVKETYKAKEKEADAKYAAEVEKMKPSLIGKDIPFEVEEGTGYEIVSCKISDVEGSRVVIDFELKITDPKAAYFQYQGMFDKSNPKLITSWNYIDKNGNNMISGHADYIEMTEKAIGATGNSKDYMDISPEFVDFAKIKFVNER